MSSTFKDLAQTYSRLLRMVVSISFFFFNSYSNFHESAIMASLYSSSSPGIVQAFEYTLSRLLKDSLVTYRSFIFIALMIYTAERMLPVLEQALRAQEAVQLLTIYPFSRRVKNLSIAVLAYSLLDERAFRQALVVSMAGLMPFSVMFYLQSFMDFQASWVYHSQHLTAAQVFIMTPTQVSSSYSPLFRIFLLISQHFQSFRPSRKLLMTVVQVAISGTIPFSSISSMILRAMQGLLFQTQAWMREVYRYLSGKKTTIRIVLRFDDSLTYFQANSMSLALPAVLTRQTQVFGSGQMPKMLIFFSTSLILSSQLGGCCQLIRLIRKLKFQVLYYLLQKKLSISMFIFLYIYLQWYSQVFPVVPCKGPQTLRLTFWLAIS